MSPNRYTQCIGLCGGNKNCLVFGILIDTLSDVYIMYRRIVKRFVKYKLMMMCKEAVVA